MCCWGQGWCGAVGGWGCRGWGGGGEGQGGDGGQRGRCVGDGAGMELRVDVLMGSGLVCGCMELRVDVKRGQGWYGAEAG